jgi:hypothetical protein
MPDRDRIHKLVDSLPEEALQAGGAILSTRESWEPEPFPTLEEVRRHIRKSAEDAGKEMVDELTKKGVRILPNSDPRANCDAAGSAWEGGTEIIYRILKVQWQELEIEERFSINDDESKLRYSHQVRGPDGKKESFEIEFECK